jgi:hypothetical protein
MAHIEFIASELIAHIFDCLHTVQDVINLASTCHRMHAIYTSSQQLRFLTNAAERQYGPLADATQLLTQNASQPAHIPRSVNISLALLSQIIGVGTVANQWADIYPFKKWKDNYIDRRLLTEPERMRVRRAIYRIWLYSTAFHSPSYPRESRLLPHRKSLRAKLLRNWSTAELAEVTDVRAVLRDTISANVCPSNGTIARKFRARHGDDAVGQLVFNLTNIHLNFPPPSAIEEQARCVPSGWTQGHYAAPPPSSLFHESSTYAAQYTTRTKAYHLGRYTGIDAGAEGWGDSIGHYYVVEDLMKLDPSQILWLKERKMCKAQVFTWVKGMGEWFENNGDTLGETLNAVLDERGVGDEDELEGGVIASDGHGSGTESEDDE